MENHVFEFRRRYVALAMKVIITFFLMGLITFNTQVRESKENQAIWYTLLGNLIQMWLPSLSQDDEDHKK